MHFHKCSATSRAPDTALKGLAFDAISGSKYDMIAAGGEAAANFLANATRCTGHDCDVARTTRWCSQATGSKSSLPFNTTPASNVGEQLRANSPN